MTTTNKTLRMETINLDGQDVPFVPGDTIYEVAQRLQTEIPTLCYDDRLEAFGGCRLCVVQIEGSKNPVASCTTKAAPGMVVRTATPEVEKLRKTLMELVVSENPSGSAAGDIDPLRGMASQELTALAARYQVTGERFAGARSGRTQPDDDNPFILRDYDHCISCYRCVRVCAEQEGDYAISVAGRGFSTQITTEFGGLLVDSACTFCGQCVQTCPTGALGDRKAMRFAVADVANAADAADTADAAAPIAATTAEPVELTRSICPYCGVGCSVDIMTRGEQIVGIRPAVDGPANEGALCVKGQYAYDFVQHPDRLKTPLVRDDNGALVPTSWDEALDRAAAGFEKIFEERGRHGVYAVASGRAPHESAYTVQKWIRTKFGTNYVDNCSRA